MPKKRRVWKKIELIETSAVGTPSYPDAHLSYSFIKALNAQLNLKETEMAEEENTQTEAQAQESGAPAENSETEEVKEEVQESSEEKEESEQSESSEEKEESAEKSADIKELIDKSVNDALAKAIKELSPQRGLVAKKEELQKMSLGELAIKSGLFKV